jgi:HlyD family secretion protein
MIRDTSAQDRPVSAGARPAAARWRLPVVVVLVLVVFGYGLSTRLGSARAVSLERLRIAEVQRADLTRDVLANGRVVAANSPTLYAPYAGTVALKIAAGAAVARGQVLAVIDSPELTSEYDREKAMLEQLTVTVDRQRILAEKQKLLARRTADEAQLALVSAQRDEQRSRRAYERGALSEVEWLRTQDAVNSAQILARHSAADAELESRSVGFELQTQVKALEQQRLVVANLERRIDELHVRAPVDGVVGTLAVVDRAAVTPNMPLLTVVDLSHLAVDVEVPESYAEELGLGMAVELRIANVSAVGEIAAVSPEVVGNQVLARVRFREAQPAGLRQNQRVSARILFEQRPQVLTLARGPFLEASGGRWAYVVADGVAERRPIRIGATSVNAVEIVEGLAPGERVVISGVDAFEDAERVTVVP